MSTQRAERRAAAVLAELDLEGPPIDVESVAARLGIRVEHADFGDDVSGVIVRSGETAVIGVNWAHHPNRQRFTIAHEIGHFLLHESGTYIDKGTHARFRDEQSGSGTDQEEIEANAFAAALLMPARWVREEAEQHPFDPADDSALNALASTFEVSAQAMSFRLSNLKLF
jgi:Zn-dependent peptidase ImmA (M78 family)